MSAAELKPGTHWKHKERGTIYTLELITNVHCVRSKQDGAKWPKTAVYRSIHGDYFSRPLAEFAEKFERFGGFE